MRRGLRRLATIGVILLIVLALAGVALYRYREKLELAGGFGPFGEGRGESIDTAVPVAVYTVDAEPIVESVSLSGEVVPLTDVSVFSMVSGKVQEVLVSEGERVAEDEVLAYVDRSEAGLTFAPAPVESTIAGVVEHVLVERGEYITPTAVLFQVIEMNTVEVIVRVPERDIDRVEVGLKAEVEVIAYPGEVFTGRVERLSPVVDPLSRTREARVRIDNPDLTLKPGMFGDVRIIVRSTADVPVVPLAAVIERGGREVVFLAEEGRARSVEPDFDIRTDERVSALTGLAPGDRVVVIGQQNLEDGDPVSVTEELGDEDL